MTQQISKYPSTFFRVSVKAVIRNQAGHVLAIRLGKKGHISPQGKWDLPGGGIEHGESVYGALVRELKEEANITAPFTLRPLGIEPMFSTYHNYWWLGLVVEVVIDQPFTYAAGHEAVAVDFVDPALLKDSPFDTEQYIYKWANSATAREFSSLVARGVADEYSGEALYPSTIYRVSLKAIIRDSQGKVLVVKEGGSDWSLPGGGFEHGEDVKAALARELYEEALIEPDFDYHLIGVDSFYVTTKQNWLMWLVYDVTLGRPYVATTGPDADDAAFLDVETFKTSIHRPGQLIYKWVKYNN